jgi:hypothetical protein
VIVKLFFSVRFKGFEPTNKSLMSKNFFEIFKTFNFFNFAFLVSTPWFLLNKFYFISKTSIYPNLNSIELHHVIKNLILHHTVIQQFRLNLSTCTTVSNNYEPPSNIESKIIIESDKIRRAIIICGLCD